MATLTGHMKRALSTLVPVLAVLAVSAAAPPQAQAASDICKSQTGDGGGVIPASWPHGLYNPGNAQAVWVCSPTFKVGGLDYKGWKLYCNQAPHGFWFSMGPWEVWEQWDYWASASDVKVDGNAFVSGDQGSDADHPGNMDVVFHNWGVTKHTVRYWTMCGNTYVNPDGATAPKPGNAKANRLVGTRGSDRLLGLGGGDTLIGRGGGDWLDGGRGADELSGGPGPDYVHGGAGADESDGGPGFDTLNGAGGPDTLSDSAGRTVVQAGAGNDVIDVDDGAGGDRVSCAGGRDRVVADGGDRVAGDCERVARP